MASQDDPSRSVRPLSRPNLVVGTLKVMAVVTLIGTVAGIAMIWFHPLVLQIEQAVASEANGEADSLVTQIRIGITLKVLGGGIILAAVLWALALMTEYCYHTALNVRVAERRQLAREAEAAGAAVSAGDVGTKMVALLAEINENTLLGEQEKARKRSRLADSRRERIRAEVGQLIAATKWPAARGRIDDLRAEYGDDPDVIQLTEQLETAIREHREIDIMTSSEQIRSYMSLGLWERAREAARHLAEKYPDNPEAEKMLKVVELEHEGTRKDDRMRLYREIEHLVGRKHYRDAMKVAETLVERHGESPEAATLRGQMEELKRNADIETRREMEAQIIEYRKQGRHKEAYEIAKLLLEQYPESPQALALQDQMDKLREQAGEG